MAQVEIKTFSSVVDDARILVGRGPSELSRLAGFARATMREAQTQNLFYRDFVEEEVTVTALPFTWTRPTNFRIFQTVEYPHNVWPKFVLPGPKQWRDEDYYYGGSNYFVFNGVAIDDKVKLGYFIYFPFLAYYTEANRPAKYVVDNATGEEKWLYLNTEGVYVETLATNVLEAAARAKVTNWLLTDWPELVKEGILAKAYKVNDNDQRAVSSFALFKSFLNDLVKGEPYAAAVV